VILRKTANLTTDGRKYNLLSYQDKKQKTVGVNLLQRKKKLVKENRTETLVHIYRFY